MAKVFGKLKLPTSFAEDFLECEIELYLSDKICPSLIRKSLELYMAGLEYYESIRNYKFLYFKKRMENIVRNPNVINEMNTEAAKILSESESKVVINPEEENQKLESLEIRERCQRLNNEIVTGTTGITSQKIRAFLNQNEQKAYETHEIIKGQISEQQKKLKLKLQQRKLRKQFKKSISAIGTWEKSRLRIALLEVKRIQIKTKQINRILKVLFTRKRMTVRLISLFRQISRIFLLATDS